MIDLYDMRQRVHFDILRGHNIRGLLKTNPNMSRSVFLRQCYSIIDSAEDAGSTQEEKDELRRRAVRTLSEKSLFFFCIFVLKLEFVNNDYGYRLCNDVQKNKWNGKLWIIARDHFKTTIITMASTLWELMLDSEKTFLINSYNKDFAIKCVSTIKGWCEDCALLHELWPETFWENPEVGHIVENGVERTWTWTKKSIELRRDRQSKEKSVDSGSINGSAGTGGHWSHLIYDDAETPETVQTADSIDQAYQDIIMSFNTGITSNFNFCFVGTFYAKDDVYVRLVKNGQINEAVIQPCVEEDGTPICYTEEQLQDKILKLNSTDAALTQMFCDPSLSNSNTFDPAWIMRWEPDQRGLNVYIVVDPAGNKQKRTNDFTVMLVVGIDTLGNLKILSIVRDRLTASSKFTTLMSLVQTFRPIRTFYEQESMQADIDLMNRYMQEYNSHFPIIPFSMKKHGKKFDRMDRLQAPLSMGKIWFPYHSWHTNYQGKNEDMIETFIREEYLGYPLIQHDDAMDALASAWQMLIDKTFQTPLMSLSNDRYAGAVSSARGDEEDFYDCYDSMSI